MEPESRVFSSAARESTPLITGSLNAADVVRLPTSSASSPSSRRGRRRRPTLQLHSKTLFRALVVGVVAATAACFVFVAMQSHQYDANHPLHRFFGADKPASSAPVEQAGDVDEADIEQEKDQPGQQQEDIYCGITTRETGYIKLPHKRDDHYFYWFVQSRRNPETDPLVLWLTGGPGCSSMMALLAENGPCHVQKNLSTVHNPYAWNSEANMIWLDQPTGVGFSYGTQQDADDSEIDVGENAYWFLQEFINKHPEFDGREFYITGESYAGHYVPAVAYHILKKNIERTSGSNARHINLAGIAIGNGLTDPPVQYRHTLDMANNTYGIKLLEEHEVEEARSHIPDCELLIQKCEKHKAGISSDASVCAQALSYCSTHLELPLYKAKRNPYDIRQFCDEEDILKCFHFDHIDAFLNLAHVKEFLQVDPIHSKAWQECDNDVGARFVNDGMLSYAEPVGVLLEAGVRVLIYAGDADLTCNWIGNEMWTRNLEWSGKRNYNLALNRPFIIPHEDPSQEDIRAGDVRSFQNLAFIRIFNSGHMVPMDQPHVALQMINMFFRDQEY